ncbi:MAG: TetR/AcrR family transcriptional regulator [Desulfobacterales bacterium]|nr:TetR/AcrR family transcriptional regulator [Desulfobacterales bacterium]
MGTRQAILEAAGPLFASRGPDGVGVREIVRKAGTSLSSVNYHFTSKENLYSACLRYVFYEKLGMGERFDLLQGGEHQTPEELSELLYHLVYHSLVSLIGEGVPAWYSELFVRSRMERHHKTRMNLLRFEYVEKLRCHVVKRLPHLDEVHVNLWFISVLAQIQYYVLEKDEVLKTLGLKGYTNPFLKRVAGYVSKNTESMLGLPRCRLAEETVP